MLLGSARHATPSASVARRLGSGMIRGIGPVYAKKRHLCRLAAPRWRFDPQRHMPRMRAATSTRTPWLAPLAANSGSASGHAILSKSPSSSLGMKRLRGA